jgi:formamidopyrimidine-DNA glycosylase
MPELPEVETIRRQLAPAVEGRTLSAVEVLDPRWCEPAPPDGIAFALTGRRVDRLARRGKYLLWELEDDVHLVMHLRMTGNLLLAGEAPYTRVRFELDSGERVLYTDPRRFGTGVLLPGSEARDAYLDERLGTEPLGDGFTDEVLRALVAGRRAPIKAVLLAQHLIAGVGNIYADEALFRAGIHPLRTAGRLSRKQVAALREAIVEVLREAIAAQGSSIDDYLQPDGSAGSFQDRFRVYGRAGEPCVTCGSPIVKLPRVGGRGTYACERCQLRPRVTRRRAAPASASGRAP